jgi:hypothetical protein
MLCLFLSVILIYCRYFVLCSVIVQRELKDDVAYISAINEKYHTLDNGFHAGLKKMQSYLGKEKENGATSYVIEKTKFDNKTRVVFFAGLEGAGHHAVRAALNACHICSPMGIISDYLFFRQNSSSASHGLFGGVDSNIHYKHLEIIYSHFLGTQVSTVDTKVEEGKLHILGLSTGAKSGMISYPNFNDRVTKAIDHPDLIPLAAAAEAANIDLRIVILIRNSYDTLYSALSRNFGGTSEARILIDNASLMNSQMSMLDPRYFMCIEYEKWKEYSASQLKAMGEFLHPRLDEKAMIAMVSKIDFRTHMQNNETSNDNSDASQLPHRHLRRRSLTIVPVVDDYSVARLGLEIEKMKISCPKLF